MERRGGRWASRGGASGRAWAAWWERPRLCRPRSAPQCTRCRAWWQRQRNHSKNGKISSIDPTCAAYSRIPVMCQPKGSACEWVSESVSKWGKGWLIYVASVKSGLTLPYLAIDLSRDTNSPPPKGGGGMARICILGKINSQIWKC